MHSSANLIQRINTGNEATWLQLGNLAEKQGDLDKAVYSFNKALFFNPVNVKALIQLASICRKREQFPKAIEYLQMILTLDPKNGEVWGALGHCNLMLDDLKKAYEAYQEALLHLPNPRDPSLWYGIGLLYDRYGCLDQAEAAFTGVLKMDPGFEKREDIYFQLGIIYKQQMKLQLALECFRFILQRPPGPLTESDIWFQIGHTHELLKEFEPAKDAYERVLKETPNNPKVLHRLGWLHHQQGTPAHQETGHNYLVQSIQLDHTDGQAWHLLGRIYMSQQKFRRSYDAFQQAIYRDPNNAVFWCSIGALYFMMNQHRDALHAYIRAIRLNPYLSEGWYDLGTLYETCDQTHDALDAYKKASELDPNNPLILDRLNHVKNGGKPPSGSQPPIEPMLPDPANPNTTRTRPPTTIPDLVLPTPGSSNSNQSESTTNSVASMLLNPSGSGNGMSSAASALLQASHATPSTPSGVGAVGGVPSLPFAASSLLKSSMPSTSRSMFGP
eukprot:c6404_g1_i1.p1 GENE.c6404_g1_i1~~c6404_g1_i1.p1  ORF type:complete len:514 (+),score=102.65 c6404_g1_i1:41-1543(+)